jgi:hypothetical protein
MIVLSERAVGKHVGEEYDSIIEVPYEPTTENIQPNADKVMASIRDLWKSQEGDPDRKVVVHLDAATPFGVMLENLQIIMKAQEGIGIELPWYKPPEVEKLDRESRELLAKLDNRQQ